MSCPQKDDFVGEGSCVNGSRSSGMVGVGVVVCGSETGEDGVGAGDDGAVTGDDAVVSGCGGWELPPPPQDVNNAARSMEYFIFALLWIVR